MNGGPSAEEVEEFMLSCRYGELEEVKAFTDRYGAGGVENARDARGNTALHMCSGNGHADVLKILLPLSSPSLVSRTNENGSPPLHWAIVNNHLKCVQEFMKLRIDQGGQLPLVKGLQQKNGAGRDAFEEAIFAGEGREEVAGWLEGYLYRAEGEPDDEEIVKEQADVTEEATDEKVDDEDLQGEAPVDADTDAEEVVTRDTGRIDLNGT